MRAAIIDHCGPPAGITIRSVPAPSPRADEVLIRVTHGSVNHVDTFVRSGAWATPLAFPFTIGRDAVGEVVSCGPAAAGAFAVGTRVWTNSLGHDGRDGALAELVLAPRSRVYPAPDAVTDSDLAALCHPAVTAHLALFRHGRLQAGQTLLVIGGGGNIGSAAVQFGVHAGARVLATAHPRDHDYLRGLGAEQVLDYREPLGESDLGDVRADLLVDAAGINDTTAYLPRMNRHGRILIIAGLGGTAVLPVGPVYLNNLTLTGFAISHATVDELAESAGYLNDAVQNRGLRPRRVDLRGLDDVALAHAQLEAGKIKGKVVVRVNGSSAPA